jgi:hypothetical protein
LFGLFIIRWFHRRQTHRRENGATSVPRQHRSSNRHTGSFRSSHRVALRDSGRRAVGNADGPGERGVGTATRRASLPHNVARALDSEVVFRRVGPWGCPRFVFRPLRLSASWVYGAKFRFEQIGHSESLLDVRIAFRRCFLPRDNPRGGDNSPGGIRGCSPSMAATFLGCLLKPPAAKRDALVACGPGEHRRASQPCGVWVPGRVELAGLVCPVLSDMPCCFPATTVAGNRGCVVLRGFAWFGGFV